MDKPRLVPDWTLPPAPACPEACSATRPVIVHETCELLWDCDCGSAHDEGEEIRWPFVDDGDENAKVDFEAFKTLGFEVV